MNTIRRASYGSIDSSYADSRTVSNTFYSMLEVRATRSPTLVWNLVHICQIGVRKTFPYSSVSDEAQMTAVILV
ncbi:hypothetical protein TNCV_583111 [Trichonephila clavipes]|nr:hypothetical protein TNCV_583111 [Trichonephila clavipes]